MAARKTVEDAPPPGLSPWVVPAISLTVGDMVLTMLWLQRGVAVEANPLLNAVIDALGTHVALGARGLLGVLFVILLGLLARRSRLAPLALPAVTAVLSGVLIWHIAGGLTTVLA